MSEYLTGRAFMKALTEAGIIDEGVTRVVIEADYKSPVVLYLERIGTKRLLQVITPPERATITYGPETRRPAENVLERVLRSQGEAQLRQCPHAPLHGSHIWFVDGIKYVCEGDG